MRQKQHSWCAPQTVRYRIRRPGKGKEEMISPRRQMTAKRDLGRAPTTGRQEEDTEAQEGEGLAESQGTRRRQGELGGKSCCSRAGRK